MNKKSKDFNRSVDIQTIWKEIQEGKFIEGFSEETSTTPRPFLQQLSAFFLTRPNNLPGQIRLLKEGGRLKRMTRLGLIFAVAVGVPLSICRAQTDQNPAEKAGKTVEHGAEATGRTLKHGTQATARTVGKGIRKTGQTLEHAGGAGSSKSTSHRHHVSKAKASPSPSGATKASSPAPAPAEKPTATPVAPAAPAANPTPSPGT